MLYLLLVVLLVLAIAGLPTWPHAAGYGWGYYPSGFFVLLIVILIVLIASGRGV
jgi:uncharacterized membrane protein (DUF4010 family)